MGNILSHNYTPNIVRPNRPLEVWANWLPALVIGAMLIPVSVLSLQLTHHVTTFCANAGAERCKPAPKDAEAAKDAAPKDKTAKDAEAAKDAAAKDKAVKEAATKDKAATAAGK